MPTVSATKLRRELFEILDQLAQGGEYAISRHGKVVARLVPVVASDWRDGLSEGPKIIGDVDAAFEPMDDLWEDYC